jgi:hypothetical protein
MWWCDLEGYGLADFFDVFGPIEFMIMCGLGHTQIGQIGFRGIVTYAKDQGIDLPTFVRENTSEILDNCDVPPESEYLKAMAAMPKERAS